MRDWNGVKDGKRFGMAPLPSSCMEGLSCFKEAHKGRISPDSPINFGHVESVAKESFPAQSFGLRNPALIKLGSGLAGGPIRKEWQVVKLMDLVIPRAKLWDLSLVVLRPKMGGLGLASHRPMM